MNKKLNFEIVSWDWKEPAPYKLLAKYAKKYKHTYETTLGSDQNYVFFSNFIIADEEKADELYMQYFEIDNE